MAMKLLPRLLTCSVMTRKVLLTGRSNVMYESRQAPLSAYVSRLQLLRPDTTCATGVDNSPLTVCLKPLDKNFAEALSPQRVAGGRKIPGIAHRSHQHAVILCSGFGGDAGAESFFA